MDQPRCDFHYDYPYPHQELDSGCQFPDETEVFPCGDKHYCRFHLPMADDEGRPTMKAGWSEDELKSFQQAISDIICDAVSNDELVNLSGVVFPDEMIFSNHRLSESLWYGVHFTKNASFTATTFSDWTSFQNAFFWGDAWFLNTTFSGEAEFNEAVYWGNALFRGSVFGGGAHFEGASFHRLAWFADATFTGSASFKGANLFGNIDFSWSGKESSSAPQDGQGITDRGPSEVGAFYWFDFSDGFVKGIANFNNRIFKTDTDFSARIFHEPPKFHGAKLHQGTKWRGTEFPNWTSLDAEQDYRTLRLAMENIRDRPQEGVFFALEQRAMRHQAKWWELRRWLSLAYDLTCGYGQSPGRPLAWLGGVSVFFFLVYMAMSIGTWTDGPPLRELLVFTVRQLLKPFEIWGRLGDGLMPALTLCLPLLFKFVATLQSILSLALLALFILALRWQFRRG